MDEQDHDIGIPAVLALLLGAVIALACTPQRGFHPHTDVPENQARIHKPSGPIDADIEAGELEATRRQTPEPGEPGLVVESSILEACGIERAETYFAYDSAELQSPARTVLDQLAACFERGALADARLSIVGHADPRGSESYNQRLARERAEAVAQFLRQRGLDSERMSVASEGESQASDDPEQWRYDRKVVVERG